MASGSWYSLINIPVRSDVRGVLHFAQEPEQIPFAVRRIFYLHHLVPGTSRGGHAHRGQHQFLMMVAGSAQVVIDNGQMRDAIVLSDPGTALYCPPMLWLELGEFSPDAVCLVLTSGVYNEADYIRDTAEFRRLAAQVG